MTNQVSVNQTSNRVVVRGQGARGPAGTPGFSFLSGSTNPSSALGKNGDTYLNNLSGQLYKKQAGAWVFESNVSTPVGAISYTYEKQTNSTTWNITHNLGFRPAVTVIDYGQNNVECDIAHTNENSLILTFSEAISGYAYLS